MSAGDDRWALVNASCDIGSQLRTPPGLHPQPPRKTPFAVVLLTDANIDHSAGVLEFRQADVLAVHSSEAVKSTLCANPMFAQFEQRERSWHAFRTAGGMQRLQIPELPNLTIRAIAVRGLLPSYAGGAQSQDAAVAYSFESDGACMVYAPIFLALEEPLLGELQRAGASFLDGTFWSDDEMLELGAGTRTARAMGHAPIYGEGGSLAAARHLGSARRFYTHVNNTNPILDPQSPQFRELRAAGFDVPSDGMELTLP